MIPAFYANVSSVKRFAVPLLALFACSDKETIVEAPPGLAPSSSSSSGGTSGSGGDDDDGGSSPKADAGGVTDAFIRARPYGKTVPKSYDASKPTPLVMVLHGYTSNAADQDRYFGVSKLAEEKGFLVALPNGTKAATSGNPFWNATDSCCNFEGNTVDDVAYLSAVIADMKRQFNVDPKRVFIAGHSNGGFMAHRMACERSGEIAAIMSLAGAQFQDPARCKPDHPVAVLQVHGDQDETVNYEGGELFAGLAYPGAKTTVATWASKNGCDAALDATKETFDLESTLDGSETLVARHTCAKGAAELWTMVGGKHVPAFTSSWAASFWKFFEEHPKP